MSLPDITIPFNLPVDIPFGYHPAIVHFVVAIPVIVLLLELINVVARKRALSVFSLFLMLLLGVAMVSAYYTGITDGKEASALLSPEGKSALKEHKLIGTYLVYISGAMILLKLLFMMFSNVIAKLFYIFILIGFIALVLVQGEEGGELVYKYGANNEALANILKAKKSEVKAPAPKKEVEQPKESEATTSTTDKKADMTAEEPKEEVTEETKKEESKEETTTQEVKEEDTKQDMDTKEEAKTEDEQTSASTTQEEPKKEETNEVSLEIPENTTPQK